MKKPTKKALLRKNLMKYFGGFFSEDAPTMPQMPPMPQMPQMPPMPSGETMGGYRSKVRRANRPKVAGPRPRMGRPMRRRGGEGESGSYLDGPMNIAGKFFDPTMGSITKGAEQTYQALGNLTNVINGGRMRSPKRRAASPKRRAASPKRRAASPKRRAALPKRRSIMVKMM